MATTVVFFLFVVAVANCCRERVGKHVAVSLKGGWGNFFLFFKKRERTTTPPKSSLPSRISEEGDRDVVGQYKKNQLTPLTCSRDLVE